MKEQCKKGWAILAKATVNLARDLYERIVNNWRSTLLSVLVAVGLWQWHKGTITTEQLVLYFGGVATVASLFYKEKK